MVRHRYKHHKYCHERHAHHVVVDVLPLVFVCQPCRERRAELSQNHEEQVYNGHALALLRVQAVPSLLVVRLVARRYVTRGLHAEGVAYERKQIDHHQHHAQKTHHKAAQSQHEYAVGYGAHIAEKIHKREPHYAHHLLAAYAHQLIKEGREGRHAYRRDETDKLYVFRLYAQSARHLAAVGGIYAAHRKDRYEQKYQQDNSERLGHPVVERIILVFCPITYANHILFHGSILFMLNAPGACLLNSQFLIKKDIFS